MVKGKKRKKKGGRELSERRGERRKKERGRKLRGRRKNRKRKGMNKYKVEREV